MDYAIKRHAESSLEENMTKKRAKNQPSAKQNQLASLHSLARDILDPMEPKQQVIGCQTRSQSASYTYLEESDEEIDVEELIASLETSDRELDHQPASEDLQQLIDKLCTKHSVGDPIWIKSPTDPKDICIRGKNVEVMREELEKEFPSYHFALVESGPLHTRQLCGGPKDIVVRRFGENGEDEQSWGDAAFVPFQLLVFGTEMNKPSQNRALYAVVPAHTIVAEQECEQMAEDAKSIIDVRREFNGQVDEVQHVLHVSNLGRYHLGVPAMVAYHRYYNNINTPTNEPNWRCSAGSCRTPEVCPHTYMNDIALLRVEEILTNFPISPNCHAVKFNRIIELTLDEIATLVEQNRVVYADEVDDRRGVQQVKGQLVRGYRTGGENPERTIGDHVTFLINEGKEQRREFPLVGGTILYVKQSSRRFAFAMIIGGIKVFDEWYYQAVLLRPALRDIELDYRHLVSDIRNSSRPPCDTYPQLTNF